MEGLVNKKTLGTAAAATLAVYLAQGMTAGKGRTTQGLIAFAAAAVAVWGAAKFL